jgi:glycosyltransferase involved in cell wall biosynthesis
MTRAAIVLPRLDPGDAVGNDARGMKTALHGAGLEAEIFAGSWSRSTPAHPVRKLSSWLRSPSDFVIYHPTVHWEEGQRAFVSSHARKIIKYHNITPARFFERYNPAYAGVCSEARGSIHQWASEAEKILCDSQFNVEDLKHENVRAVMSVVPPFHDLDAMQDRDADVDWLSRIVLKGQQVFLSVGRIVPNKRYDLLIEALAAARRAADVRLILAGRIDPALGSYLEELKRQARELGLGSSLWFTGHISESRLKALFLTASCYIVASDHEGFCVPVIEAMNLKIPVVASGQTAVEETLGGTGIFRSQHDPFFMAAAAIRLSADTDTARAIGQAEQSACVSRFSHQMIRSRFLEELGLG